MKFRPLHDRVVVKRIDAELEQHRRHLAELVQLRTAALLQTEARASQILNSTADGVYGIDAAGKITFINPAACRMLGLAAEAAIGRCSHDLFHHHRADGSPYPIEDCGAHRSLGLGRETRVDDEVFWHSDGHPVPVMYAVHPTTADGQPNGAVISFVDISAQRAAALAREMVDTPAADMGPLQIETIAREIAESAGAAITVTTGDALQEANYPAVHAVGRAAAPHRAPRGGRTGSCDPPGTRQRPCCAGGRCRSARRTP